MSGRITVTQTQGADLADARRRASALAKRFARAGNRADYQSAVGLYESVPRLTLKEYGSDLLTFHPDICSSAYGWIQWQPWLVSEGYAVHRRYDPGWVPSWVKDPAIDKWRADDHFLWDPKENAISATRIEDGARVWLKRCGTREMDIVAYLSSEPLRSDPRNHCCPLLDILCPPVINGDAYWILVFPLLRDIDETPPDTVGEQLQSFVQLAEGLVFMHEHNVAHRDICPRNIMLDASKVIPTGWIPEHPEYCTTDGVTRAIVQIKRTVAPVRYYFIDFGESCHFPSFSERKFVVGTRMQIHAAPEISETVPYDPFALDMFMFGCLMQHWVRVDWGFEVLVPLIQELTCPDPRDRLTAPEMLVRLNEIVDASGPLIKLAPYMLRIYSRTKFIYRLFWNVAESFLFKREESPHWNALPRPS